MMNWTRVLLLKDARFRKAVEKVWGKKFLEKAIKKAKEEDARS